MCFGVLSCDAEIIVEKIAFAVNSILSSNDC